MSEDKTYLVNCDRAKYDFLRKAAELYDEHGYVEFTWRTGRQRTLTQNRALHKWLAMLADCLNAAGLDQRKVLREDVEMPWSMEACKEFLWKPIQEAAIQKSSTAEAERKDYGYIEQILSHHLQAKFGLDVPPWPEKRLQEIEKQQGKDRRAA